jgi:molecular chaperone GrpE
MRRNRAQADQQAENGAVDPGVASENDTEGLDTDSGDQTERVSAELQALTGKVQALNDENLQLKDQLLRAIADFQNFRKRAEQERIALRQYAAEQIVVDLLPVLDNFERTLAAATNGASVDAIIEGVKAIDRQMRSVLETKKLERIPAEGVQFDPELHHAIAAHVTDEVEEGTVTHEIEAGYKLAGKVIRPAKVRVAKKP